MLEGPVDICQRSEVGVEIADPVAADRWGQHSIANAVQGVWEAEEGLEGGVWALVGTRAQTPP